MLLNTITPTAQWLHDLISTADIAVLDASLQRVSRAYIDVMLQNTSLSTNVWVECYKEAVIGESVVLAPGTHIVLRIPYFDDNFNIVSLVSQANTNDIVMIVLGSYPDR